jgi:hypothetical protein
MTRPRIPGHEPDSNDMSEELGMTGEAMSPKVVDPDLLEEHEAASHSDLT